MLKILKVLRTVFFVLSILIPTVQKAMFATLIPLPLFLQKTLLVWTYGYGIWSLGQQYKLVPKKLLLKNRVVHKTKKDIKKLQVDLTSGFLELLNAAQREAFFEQKNMCQKYNPHSAKKAEENSLHLMLARLHLPYTVVKPLLSFS
jgi:hypothetical protein